MFVSNQCLPNFIFFIVFFFFFVASAAFNHNLLVSDEKLLVKRLLDRYARLGKIGRPVLNTSETVTVNFDLSLIQIVDVDEKNQVLVLNIWYNYVSTRHISYCIV